MFVADAHIEFDEWVLRRPVSRSIAPPCVLLCYAFMFLKNVLALQVAALPSEDAQNIWVATNRGVSKINYSDASNYQVRVIQAIDGLASDEVNGVYTDGQKVWVATHQGLSVFEEEKLPVKATPPAIYITGFTVSDETTPIQDGQEFKYNHNKIKVDFVGLSFKSRGAIQYQYFLEGLEADTNITIDQHIEYASLPPGEYQFMVRAINKDQVLSAQPATISFIIKPPFWQTWWFYVLCVLTALGIILIIFQYTLY